MKLILAIFLLGFIIFIHELGHFLMAKKNGITVTEFSLGMGPRIASFVKGETRYSLKLLPIGGSCMMLGEDDTVDAEGSFHTKGVWARFAVIFGGALFNFILAFVLALILVSIVGVDLPRLTKVEPNSPAAMAGLQEGDLITKINSRSIHFSKEIGLNFIFRPITDKPIDITFKRDGEKHTVSVAPQNNYLGIGYNVNYEKLSPVKTVLYSAYELEFNIRYALDSIGHLISGKASVKEISGPVGIVNVVGDIVEQSEDYGVGAVALSLISFSILISTNLGVMNLLPLPALDGGRLVFLLIEAIRRKPIAKEKEAMVHFIGMALLMALMVFVVYNDVRNIIG